MTSEVCVMNRLAVVLAADSATTVTSWSDRGKEERYFKGANKIFQLSTHHPVGMMVFNSADLLKVPWEVVLKQFRSNLERKSFNSLEGYAAEFFAFLNASTPLFPAQVQKEYFLENARTAAIRPLLMIHRNEDGGEQRRAAVEAAVVARREELSKLPFAPGIDEGHVTEIVAGWREELVAMLQDWQEPLSLTYPSELPSLADLGMQAMFKVPSDFVGTTGLVFAGFGDHEIFPAMVEYESCGMIAGRHVSREVSRAFIDHDIPAWLSAFAQTSMSDTFSLGLSQDIYTSLLTALRDRLVPFVEEVIGASGGDAAKIEDISSIVQRTTKSIGDAVLEKARQEHAFPLRRVLGALPVDEMAELAETLINLQSLKEKVTKPSQTVGGPIDVAVIAKNEGLVWIKRKHFFDIGLNSRYMQRLAAQYG